MEVKPIADGYKKTVAGVIPNDWSVRHMGGVSRVVSGQVDPRIEPHSLMPLVAPDHIESGTGRLARSIPTATEQRAISGKYLFRSGTVIYSKIRPHLRKVCIAPFDGLCSADMYPLLPADDVHPGFLFASLLGERFSKYAESVSIRSGMPKINREELASFEFVLPSSRQEQAQIAETLADADALIDSLEQLLTKKRQIKQGAMQELLTGKRRLEGFQQAWHRLPFDSVLERINSKRHQIQASAYQTVGSLPVIDQGQTTPVAYSDAVESRFICPAGGALIFGDHTCITKFVDFDFVVGADGVQVLLARQGQVTRFHAYQLEMNGVESTGYNRHFKFLQERHFLCPAIAEQAAIARVLSDMDAELGALESRLTKARALKQAMAQALLTGRIRLVPGGVA